MNGTRQVLSAAQVRGVKRVVVTSTIVTLGPTAAGVVGNENMTRITQRFFTEYEESKTLAEREILQWVARGGPGKLTAGNSVTLMIDQYARGRLPVLLKGGVTVGIHIGKPAGEIYGAIVAGLLWGLIVFRARSLWAVLLMHWALGVSLDFFICFAGKGG